MQESSLAVQLQSFGLTNTEAAIYLHLVNGTSKSILEIARELNMPRTSVYDNTVKLAEKGLIQKIVTFKSQKLKAYPISILHAALDKEKTRLEELQQQLKALETSLSQAQIAPAATEVRYYYGPKGFQQMMWNSLHTTETIGYSQFGRIEVVGEAFVKKHVTEMVNRGIADRVISNPNFIKKYVTGDTSNSIIHHSRAIFQKNRTLSPEQLYISGDITIYNNIFAVAYWKQGEVVGVEIENAELVKTQRSIFELLWQLAKPIE